jgi:hypothetical protein
MGIFATQIFPPGVGFIPAQRGRGRGQIPDSGEIFLGFIPDNAVRALRTSSLSDNRIRIMLSRPSISRARMRGPLLAPERGRRGFLHAYGKVLSLSPYGFSASCPAYSSVRPEILNPYSRLLFWCRAEYFPIVGLHGVIMASFIGKMRPVKFLKGICYALCSPSFSDPAPRRFHRASNSRQSGLYPVQCFLSNAALQTSST